MTGGSVSNFLPTDRLSMSIILCQTTISVHGVDLEPPLERPQSQRLLAESPTHTSSSTAIALQTTTEQTVAAIVVPAQFAKVRISIAILS